MPVDAIEQLFASHAAERKAAVLEFTPDEIRITAENKFDDGIYQLLYDVWKETSGEYDPKDDKPIVDPRGNVHTQNETKFKYWAMEQYGMTAEEYRGHTLDGTLKTLDEIDIATSKVMMILALPSMIKNAVKTIKDFANGVPFDTSIGFAAGNTTGTTNISTDMEKKILEGRRKNKPRNQITGGHSPHFVNNNNPDFAVQILGKNPDGTTNVHYVKCFPDGNLSKLKKNNTLFPDTWSDESIINSIKTVGDTPPIGIRTRDGTTLHREIVNGVQVEVMKIGSDVTSGYPTGGGITGLPNEFISFNPISP